MTFGKTCDTLWSHPKVRAASREGRSLWLLAQSYSMQHLTDGFISTNALVLLDATEEHADSLVRSGLWELVVDDAGQLEGWQFHDWIDYNPLKVEVLADRRLHRAARAMPNLRGEVRARDGSTCRYCGKHVIWTDRRSANGGTYDVANPADDVTAESLVVACRACAKRKAGRSEEDSGMRLRRLPVRRDQHLSPVPSPFPDRSESVPRSDPSPSKVVPSSVPKSYLGTHQPPYPVPPPLRGGGGTGVDEPASDHAQEHNPCPTRPTGPEPSPDRTGSTTPPAASRPAPARTAACATADGTPSSAVSARAEPTSARRPSAGAAAAKRRPPTPPPSEPPTTSPITLVERPVERLPAGVTGPEAARAVLARAAAEGRMRLVPHPKLGRPPVEPAWRQQPLPLWLEAASNTPASAHADVRPAFHGTDARKVG